MVATDILLALLINVATGELCKAFAFQIAKFWNFKAPSLADSVTLAKGQISRDLRNRSTSGSIRTQR